MVTEVGYTYYDPLSAILPSTGKCHKKHGALVPPGLNGDGWNQAGCFTSKHVYIESHLNTNSDQDSQQRPEPFLFGKCQIV